MPEDLSAIDPFLANLLGGVTGPAGVMLAGVGPPQTLGTYGLDPLDGINDPWRFSANDGQWFSQFYEVTWLAGDEIPSVSTSFSTPDGESSIKVVELAAPTLGDVSSATTSEIATCVGGVITLTAGGSGVIGLVVIAGATPPSDPSIDVTTLFGADVTVTGPYEFPPSTPAVPVPGPDGAFYMDLTSLAAPVIYGPKTDGDWGIGG